MIVIMIMSPVVHPGRMIEEAIRCEGCWIMIVVIMILMIIMIRLIMIALDNETRDQRKSEGD